MKDITLKLDAGNPKKFLCYAHGRESDGGMVEWDRCTGSACVELALEAGKTLGESVNAVSNYLSKSGIREYAIALEVKG